MPPQQESLLNKLIDKFSNSRDFTISFVLHLILIFIFGTTVLFQAVQEPPDFEGESGGFVGDTAQADAPQPDSQVQPQETTVSVTSVPTPSAAVTAITTTAPSALDFTMPSVVTPNIATTPTTPTMAAPTTSVSSTGMSAGAASQIKAFTGGWGKGSGSGQGTKSREFDFTAYIGQYAGGNWNSTIQVINNKIEKGSLPNLLYMMSNWSNEKIKTNYKSVQAIKLDSDQLFSTKPPFIFLTGSRDFKLTDKEVENLRKYIQLGGAIWGDSSLPGKNSRFDIAFRREMKRVIPDVDKDFEPLPLNHPIYTKGYFPEVKDVPSGLNYYREPVYAMKIYGEIAILYTANDYADMWQVGLSKTGQIDLALDPSKTYAVTNPGIYDFRDTYLRNINPEGLLTAYKFGTNIVIHLLTRWEDKVKTAQTL